MFVFWVVAKGGSTVIIKEDKLNTVMSLVHVVFGEKFKTRFCKNNKQMNIDIISVILTLYAIYSLSCRYRRVFYQISQL